MDSIGSICILRNQYGNTPFPSFLKQTNVKLGDSKYAGFLQFYFVYRKNIRYYSVFLVLKAGFTRPSEWSHGSVELGFFAENL